MSRWYGRADSLALGAFKGPFGANVRGKYADDLASDRRYAGPVSNSSETPTALDVYRAALRRAPDRSVVVASIGFATNLAALLRAEPALVARKVRRVVWMGGRFPAGGRSYNLDCGDGRYDASRGCAGNASYAVARMPSSVAQVWTALGDRVRTGARLTSCAPATNPCRRAMIDREGPGSARKSWDPLAVLVAVRGANPAWFESVPGTNSVDATGANTWVGAAGTNATNQTYLSFHAKRGAAQRAAVESTLDELLCAPPKLRPAHFIGN